MARSAMRAMNRSLSNSNPLRRHTRLQEAMFWIVVAGGGYGIYLLSNFRLGESLWRQR